MDVRLNTALGELKAARGILLGPACYNKGGFTHLSMQAIAAVGRTRPCFMFLMEVLRTYQIRDRRPQISSWVYGDIGEEYEVIEMLPAGASWHQKRMPASYSDSLREEATYIYTGIADGVFRELPGYPDAYFFPGQLIGESPDDAGWAKTTGVPPRTAESPL